MNTALILHLLGLVEHLTHGRHFHAFVVPECFQWVKVRSHGSVMLGRRLVCGLIKVSEHSASVTWR